MITFHNHFKSKFNPRHHGFIKSNTTTTILLLDFLTPLINYKRHVETIYFDFSNAFDVDPHTLLLLQLDDFGAISRLRRLVP